MKNIIRRVLRQLVRYVARHAGLGVFGCELSEPDNSPENVAFLALLAHRAHAENRISRY